VIVAPAGGTRSTHVLVSDGKADLSVPGCGTFIVNAGQSGYYRTLYSPALFASISSGFGSIAAIDQLGILADSWALGLAGLQPATDFLELARATPVEADPQVWRRIAGVLNDINDYFDGEPAQQATFRRYATQLLAPVMARVGWTARAGEPGAEAILRNRLIETLGALGDPGVVAEARMRFAAQDRDPGAVPAPLRKSILGVVARQADAKTWEKLHAAALAEKTPLIRNELYALLASPEDAGLARRALDLALTPEPGATTSADMIAHVGHLHPDLAFDFAIEHLDAVMDKVDSPSRTRYLPLVASRSMNPAMIGKLRAYAAAHLAASERRDADAAAAAVEYRVKVRTERLPAIDAWVGQHRVAGL
jgi:aminopeptidase N